MYTNMHTYTHNTAILCESQMYECDVQGLPLWSISTLLVTLDTCPLANKSITFYVTVPWDTPCISISLCTQYLPSLPESETESRSVMPDSSWSHGWTIVHGSGYPCPSPGNLPNPELEPRSPALQVDSLPAEPISWPRNQTGVSCTAGRFFTNWATWETHLFLGCHLYDCQDPVRSLPPVHTASLQNLLSDHGAPCHLETDSITSVVHPFMQESTTDTGNDTSSLTHHQGVSLFKFVLKVSVLSSPFTALSELRW